MYNLNGLKLIKILSFKLFTSDTLTAIINIILPIIVSILCINYSNSITWWLPIIIIFICIIFFNIISAILKNKKNKKIMMQNIITRCYNDQMVINEKAANIIYRLNKRISECLKDNKPLNNKKIFDKIADFQTISFTVCDSIYEILTSEYGDDIKCEVTLMNKNLNNNEIKMVAYSNYDKKMPSSYRSTFSTNDMGIYFVKLFDDLNGEIACIPTKEQIKNDFKKLQGSETRENEICQYIGIPIKTNRNQIELLLQIDVSKENVFGKTKEDISLFAKNILYPYAVLLHKSFERDLIFNKFYESIITILSNHNSP